MSTFFGPLIEKGLPCAKYFMHVISFTLQKCADKYSNFIDKALKLKIMRIVNQ